MLCIDNYSESFSWRYKLYVCIEVFFKIQVGFIDYAVLLVVDTTFCISYLVKFQDNCVGQFQ